MKIQVIIVDDDTPLVEALSNFLSGIEEIKEVIHFPDCISFLNEYSSLKHPILLLLDMIVPFDREDPTSKQAVELKKYCGASKLLNKLKDLDFPRKNILLFTALGILEKPFLIDLGFTDEQILSKPARAMEIRKVVRQAINQINRNETSL